MTSAIPNTISNDTPGIFRTIFYIILFGFCISLNFGNLSYSSFENSLDGQIEIATYSPSYLNGFDQALIATQSPNYTFQNTGKDFSFAGLFISFRAFHDLAPAGFTYQTFQGASFNKILDQLHHDFFFF